MLCRVFHKRKKEPSTQYRLDVEQETIGCSSANMGSCTHPIYQSMPYNNQLVSYSNEPHQEESNSPPNTMLNLAVLHYNFLEDTPMIGMNGRGGDEYGFLLDLGLDDENMGDGEPLDLGETILDNGREKGFP